MSNKKVQDELVNVSGGLEFLQAVGFQLVFDEADGYSPPAYLVLCSGKPSSGTDLRGINIASHWYTAKLGATGCREIRVAPSLQVCSASRG